MYINNYKIQWESWKHVLHGPASFKADVKYSQSQTKVLRQFSKTILYLNEIFFICSHPLSPPNNVAKHFVGVYLFPTLKKGEGREAMYLSQIYTKEKGR